MQNYTTIIGVLEMRENNFSYRDCRARYDIGQGTEKLIIDRFQQLGLPLSDLKTMKRKRWSKAFLHRKTSVGKMFLFLIIKESMTGSSRKEASRTFSTFGSNIKRNTQMDISTHSLFITSMNSSRRITQAVSFLWQ